MNSRGVILIAGVSALSAAIGALAAIIITDRLGSSNEPGQGSLTVTEHLQEIRTIFDREWPIRGGYDNMYNSHEELEQEFNRELYGLVEERGIDFARNKVEDWRSRYALWVGWVREALQELSATDGDYEGVETILFRGNRVLDHVDAMLGA